jgi:hypothetical protein
MLVMSLVIRLLTALSARKAVMDETTASVETTAVEAQVMLVLRAVNDLVEKLVVVVVSIIKAVNEIFLFLIITAVFVISVLQNNGG